jgi:hypothetical protein
MNIALFCTIFYAMQLQSFLSLHSVSEGHVRQQRPMGGETAKNGADAED